MLDEKIEALLPLTHLTYHIMLTVRREPMHGYAISKAVAELSQGRVAPGTRVELGPHAVCVIADAPSWHTLFTSMFMHGGWMHILGNMWFLWVFGNNVEDSMGHVRFLGFYLLCGLAAAAAQILQDTSSVVPMVGASGAIGGVR